MLNADKDQITCEFTRGMSYFLAALCFTNRPPDTLGNSLPVPIYKGANMLTL